MKTISLTIPMDANALVRTGEMLYNMADDLDSNAPKPVPVPNDAPVNEEEPSPSLFSEKPVEAPKPDAAPLITGSTTLPQEVAPIVESAAHSPITSESASVSGVDLAPSTTNPEISIPWDARIHASSKAKLSKAPNGWKMKRGVNAGLVEQVEAELIAAMGASPVNPVKPSTTETVDSPQVSPEVVAPVPSPNAAPVQPAPVAASPTTTPSTPAAPVQQPATPAGTISTFPELMARITASGIDQATVTAAVNKQGLQALPLLASRPDLIPGVVAELFPGG